MSIGDRLIDSYKKAAEKFEEPEVTPRESNYEKAPRINFETEPTDLFPELIEACTELYNEIDSAVEVLKRTAPNAYNDYKDLIVSKIIGGFLSGNEVFVFVYDKIGSSFYGRVAAPNMDLLPLGIRSVIDLLTKSMECRVGGLICDSDSYYYTAWVAFRSLEGALKQFCPRFNYVMLYPHRILVDRVVLEGVLKREGMDRVTQFVQSAEEHFNQGKYVEFCAMSRNAMQEAVKMVCLLLGETDHGFADNLKHLEEIGYMKSTIVKQAKEYGGSLSACGSHPPAEKLSDQEAKFLLDSLYGFLGLFALRLSSFKKQK